MGKQDPIAEPRAFAFSPEFLERFEVGERLGEGGMGWVHRAVQRDLGRQVALKVLKSREQDFLDRFRREGRVLALLRHPSIMQVYDAGVDGEIPYLVLELIDGRPLAGELGTPWPVARALRLLIELARALHHAHLAGLVHRDVKPENVFLLGEEDVKVADFGLARHAAGGNTITLPDVIIGTPAYLAPEQVEHRPVTAAADQYALGLLFFQVLTGRLPFEGDSVMEVLTARLRLDPPSPGELRPGLPPAVSALCLRMLARDPRDRHASLEDVASACEGVLAADRSEAATRFHPAAARTVVVGAPQADAPAPPGGPGRAVPYLFMGIALGSLGVWLATGGERGARETPPVTPVATVAPASAAVDPGGDLAHRLDRIESDLYAPYSSVDTAEYRRARDQALASLPAIFEDAAARKLESPLMLRIGHVTARAADSVYDSFAWGDLDEAAFRAKLAPLQEAVRVLPEPATGQDFTFSTSLRPVIETYLTWTLTAAAPREHWKDNRRLAALLRRVARQLPPPDDPVWAEPADLYELVCLNWFTRLMSDLAYENCANTASGLHADATPELGNGLLTGMKLSEAELRSALVEAEKALGELDWERRAVEVECSGRVYDLADRVFRAAPRLATVQRRQAMWFVLRCMGQLHALHSKGFARIELDRMSEEDIRHVARRAASLLERDYAEAPRQVEAWNLLKGRLDLDVTDLGRALPR